jgi:hypothetical protein
MGLATDASHPTKEPKMTVTIEETAVCECGAATGERCSGRQEVRILWMPEHLRESHSAAGGARITLAEGAELLRVDRECLARLEEFDGDWIRALGDVAPAQVALTAVESAYAAATGEWTGLDWTTDEEIAVSDAEEGSEEETAAQAALDALTEEVESDARAAEEEALAGLTAARGGRWDEAVKHAGRARYIEDQYGDAPVWGPFARAVEAGAALIGYPNPAVGPTRYAYMVDDVVIGDGATEEECLADARPDCVPPGLDFADGEVYSYDSGAYEVAMTNDGYVGLVATEAARG